MKLARGNGHVGGRSDHEAGSGLTESQKSNSKVREQRINEACEHMYLNSKKVAALLISSGIKDLRDDSSDIKSLLREDFGITAEVINARYGTYKLERKARDNGDQVTLDIITEMFEALPIGKIVDLADALDTDDSNVEITDSLDQAKKKGTAAGAEGKNFDSNPYPEGSKHHQYWAQNWKVAQSKLADAIGKGGGAAPSSVN